MKIAALSHGTGLTFFFNSHWGHAYRFYKDGKGGREGEAHRCERKNQLVAFFTHPNMGTS